LKRQPLIFTREYTIAPPRSFRAIDWHELWRFRGLFTALTRRDVVVRYKQTVLGLTWALIRPLMSVLTLTIVFNRVAQIPAEGNAPYAVFVLIGLVFWQCYSDIVTNGSQSMVQNAPLLQKVYFPRIYVPLAAAVTALVDGVIAVAILALLLVFYGIRPAPAAAIVLPLLTALVVVGSLGLSFAAAALHARYRDVRHGLPFVMELLKYATPIVYPASLLDAHPTAKAFMLWLNPIAGVIAESRKVILGTGATDWQVIGVVAVVSTAMFLTGLLYFRMTELYVADVI
jgi:lipopolysaccharide transport system permease protein